MNATSQNPILIVVAEDDPDDQLLICDALAESEVPNQVQFVANGQDLLDYLRHSGPYVGDTQRRPDLILLDLNMPKKDGREALAEIKADAVLRSIPVVVLTTSKSCEEVQRIYDLGANSYMVKPSSYVNLVQALGSMTHYWFTTVRLPNSC